MEGPLSDQWADVRLFGSGYRSRHYHPRIPNRQTRRHRIARGNAQHRSGAKFQICLASFNLGWKLAAVLRGQCGPELLRTYSDERQAIAKELIDFDREWARILSAPLKSPNDARGDGVGPAEVQDYFVRHLHYTAGTATRYKPSVISGKPVHQHLAKDLEIGTRFHSAPVIRLAD